MDGWRRVLCAQCFCQRRRQPMPKAGALSLASQAKYCGCIKYFPSCRKTKETPHGLRAKDEDEVGLNKLCGHEMRQGLCLRSLSRPLSALYIKLFMPGPRLSVSAPTHRISRCLGWVALESRDSQNLPTTYIQLLVGRIFMGQHFAGEFMKNLKQLCGFGRIVPAARWDGHWSLGWSVGRQSHQKLFMAFCVAKARNTNYALIG